MKREDYGVSMQLNCSFRMPFSGYLTLPHATQNVSLELSYTLPMVKFENYVCGLIKTEYFSKTLQTEWEALPTEAILELGAKVILVLKKDIIDAIECSPLGELYVYRPVELRIKN